MGAVLFERAGSSLKGRTPNPILLQNVVFLRFLRHFMELSTKVNESQFAFGAPAFGKFGF